MSSVTLILLPTAHSWARHLEPAPQPPLIIAAAADDSEEVDAGLAAVAIGSLRWHSARGIGVGVDALIRKKHVIYQRPSTSGLQVGGRTVADETAQGCAGHAALLAGLSSTAGDSGSADAAHRLVTRRRPAWPSTSSVS